MNLKGKCLICNITQNLNTILKVKLDDNSEYEVSICDQHADTITIKTAKEKVRCKLNELNDIRRKLSEMGLSISGESAGGVLIGSIKNAEPEKQEVCEQEQVIDKPIAKSAKNQSPPKYRIPKVSSTDARAYDSLDIESAMRKEQELAAKKGEKINLPQIESVQMQESTDASGAPMVIQKVVKSTDGTTTISITKTSDADIQKRVKMMEMATKNGNDIHSFGKGGYDLRECTLCHASGVVNQGKQACPKCKGQGYV